MKKKTESKAKNENKKLESKEQIKGRRSMVSVSAHLVMRTRWTLRGVSLSLGYMERRRSMYSRATQYCHSVPGMYFVILCVDD